MTKVKTIKGLLVSQLTSKPIAIASIQFEILRKMVKFTYREPQDYDPFNPEKKAHKVAEDLNKSYYQRLTNDKRINSIYKFLLTEINNLNEAKNNAIGSFPTAIIISLDINQEFDSEEEYDTYVATMGEDEYIGAFFKIVQDKRIELKVPMRKVSLIVDGQHRLSAMIKLYEDALTDSIRVGRYPMKNDFPNLTNEVVLSHLSKFDLNCTILLGFDKWEQGKVFADVNFNQKPVNKSLYYDIFGSYPDPNRNDIFLAHMLAMHLNNNDDSVIKGFIKMLGTGPGYFSQAFFVEALLSHFNKNGIWGSLPMDYINGGSEYKMLPKILKAYFKAIKDEFIEYWPKADQDTSRKYPHILVKTTGMGALLKLISPIYRKLKRDIDFKSIDRQALVDQFKNELKKAKPRSKEFFSQEGEYSGSGSLGLQNKLFNEIAIELGYHAT